MRRTATRARHAAARLLHLPGARPILVVAIVLVALRVVAPVGLRWWAERTLDRTPGYDARIADVDLHLWRGAYRIEGLAIDRVTATGNEPYFATAALDLSVQWKQLIRGQVVGEIALDRPRLNLIAAKKPPQDEKDVQERAEESERQREDGTKPGAEDLETRTGAEVDWRDQVEGLFPLTLNRITIRDGEIRYIDLPNQVDAALGDLELSITGLTNRPLAGERHPCGLVASATTMGGGRLSVDARVDPLADAATFILRASLENVHLPALNELLRSYAGFDVEDGTLDLYVDATADQGRITGTAKPLITELNVLDASKERKEDGLKQVVKEAAIGAAAEVAEAQGEDRQAAEIPLEGTMGEPSTDVWSVVGSVLRNAFIASIKPGHGGSGEGEGEGERSEPSDADPDGDGKPRRRRPAWSPPPTG
jgi:hypothetical protein